MPIGKLDFQPYVNPYVALPTKEYSDLQEQLRGQYDDTAAIYDYLDEASKSMKALDIDEPLKQRILQETQDRIKIAAEKGNYEDLGRIARREAKDFATKYRPVADELRKVQEYQKKQEEDYRAGKISKNAYDLGLTESLKRYKGVEAGDSFRGHIAANKYDVIKAMSEFANGWNADSSNTQTGWIYLPNEHMYQNVTTKVKQVLPTVVRDTLINTFKNNPDAMAFLQDEAYLTTHHLSDDDIKNQFNDSFLKASEKLDAKGKIKLAETYKAISEMSPAERANYLRNTIVDNTLNTIASGVAEKEGFTEFEQTSALHNQADALINKLLEDTLPKGEEYDTQVFKNNFFDNFEELDYTPNTETIDKNIVDVNTKLMNGLDQFAKSLGLTPTDATNGGYGNYTDGRKVYTADEINNKFKNSELYKQGQLKLQSLQKEREAIKNAKPLERIDILSKNNTMLSDIRDNFNKEWKEGKIKVNPSKSEEKQKADIILKRYNSKLNSLKNNNVDQYYIPSQKYLDEKQSQYIGTNGKEGIIKDRLIYSDKSHKMENFDTWLSQNKINRTDFFKKAKVIGLSSGKYEGDLYISYNGKDIPITGSKTMHSFRKPLRDMWKVVSENKDRIDNIDLNNILPGVKVSVEGKDYFNENNEHEGREPIITISSSVNPAFQSNIGETYTWTEFMKLVDKIEKSSLKIK